MLHMKTRRARFIVASADLSAGRVPADKSGLTIKFAHLRDLQILRV